MLRNVKSLTSLPISAADGEIGKVHEFYFDDETWTIRYLIVKTGGWLSDRKVLISPAALESPDWENENLPVNLTKEQVKSSPDIDTDKPVSRQQEIDLYGHYGWPYHGTAGIGFYGGMGMIGLAETKETLSDKMSSPEPKRPGDPHLRSTREVRGYRIHAIDGDIGEVEDFLIDDESWKLRFLVVDTGNWLPGKKVIISPKWIREVRWANSAVYVDLTVDAVKNSPEYDPLIPVHSMYEEDLYRYYGRERE